MRASGGVSLPDWGARAISLTQLKTLYLEQVHAPRACTPCMCARAHPLTCMARAWPHLEQVVRRCVAESWLGRRFDKGANKWSYTRLAPESVNLCDLISHVLARLPDRMLIAP